MTFDQAFVFSVRARRVFCFVNGVVVMCVRVREFPYQHISRYVLRTHTPTTSTAAEKENALF